MNGFIVGKKILNFDFLASGGFDYFFPRKLNANEIIRLQAKSERIVLRHFLPFGVRLVRLDGFVWQNPFHDVHGVDRDTT